MASRISVLGQQHGKHGGTNKDNTDDQIVTIEQLEELERIMLEKIKLLTPHTTRFLESPLLPRIFYVWKDIENENAPKDWIYENDILNDDKNCAIILSKFLGKHISYGMSSYKSRVDWIFNLDNLKMFLNTDDLYAKCKKIKEELPDWLEGKLKLAIDTYIEEYENPRENK